MKTTEKKIYADDGNMEVEYEGLSHDEAAQHYVEICDWGESTKTICIRVSTYYKDEDGEPYDEEFHTFEFDPKEPKCNSDDHDWQSPIEVVGGIEENPGVIGHGGGAIITEVCSHCGIYRITNTCEQNSENGEIVSNSIEYLEADLISINWINS